MDDNFIFVNDVGPRDGLQNQTIDVSPETRVKLIEKLLNAGVHGVEVASFVSPKAKNEISQRLLESRFQ